MLNQPLKIAIIGTGNVGYHLAKQLKSTGVEPVAVVSRHLDKSRELIGTLHLSAKACTTKGLKHLDADIIILSIPDSAIEKAISEFDFPDKAVIVHTSGAQPMTLLQACPHHGVLYPFQTFSKLKNVDFGQVPLYIEANTSHAYELIHQTSLLLNDDVRQVTSTARIKIHLAAVFACNFTNHVYAITEEILKDTGGKLSDLNHLMKETVEKAVDLSAREVQTGPAIRGDQEVIDKHLELLKDYEQARQLYALISKQIADFRPK